MFPLAGLPGLVLQPLAALVLAVASAVIVRSVRRDIAERLLRGGGSPEL